MPDETMSSETRPERRPDNTELVEIGLKMAGIIDADAPKIEVTPDKARDAEKQISGFWEDALKDTGADQETVGSYQKELREAKTDEGKAEVLNRIFSAIYPSEEDVSQKEHEASIPDKPQAETQEAKPTNVVQYEPLTDEQVREAQERIKATTPEPSLVNEKTTEEVIPHEVVEGEFREMTAEELADWKKDEQSGAQATEPNVVFPKEPTKEAVSEKTEQEEEMDKEWEKRGYKPDWAKAAEAKTGKKVEPETEELSPETKKRLDRSIEQIEERVASGKLDREEADKRIAREKQNAVDNTEWYRSFDAVKARIDAMPNLTIKQKAEALDAAEELIDKGVRAEDIALEPGGDKVNVYQNQPGGEETEKDNFQEEVERDAKVAEYFVQLEKDNPDFINKTAKFYYGNVSQISEGDILSAKALVSLAYGDKLKGVDINEWNDARIMEEAQRIYFEHLIDDPELIAGYPKGYDFYKDLQQAFTGWGKGNGGDKRRDLLNRLQVAGVDLEQLNSWGIDTSVLGSFESEQATEEPKTEQEKPETEKLKETKAATPDDEKLPRWDAALNRVLQIENPVSRRMALERLIPSYLNAPDEWLGRVKQHVEATKELQGTNEELINKVRTNMIEAIAQTSSPDAERIAREIGLITPQGDTTRVAFPERQIEVGGETHSLKEVMLAELRARVDIARSFYERYELRVDYTRRAEKTKNYQLTNITTDDFKAMAALEGITGSETSGALLECLDKAVQKYVQIGGGEDGIRLVAVSANQVEVRVRGRDQIAPNELDLTSNIFAVDSEKTDNRTYQNLRAEVRNVIQFQLENNPKWSGLSDIEKKQIITDSENLAWQFVWASDVPDQFTKTKLSYDADPVTGQLTPKQDYIFGHCLNRLTQFGEWREFQARRRSATIGSLRLLVEHDKAKNQQSLGPVQKTIRNIRQIGSLMTRLKPLEKINTIDEKNLYGVFSQGPESIPQLAKTTFDFVEPKPSESLGQTEKGMALASNGRFFRGGDWASYGDKSPQVLADAAIRAGDEFLSQMNDMNKLTSKDVNAGYFGGWSGKVVGLVVAKVIPPTDIDRLKLVIAKDVFWKFSRHNPNTKDVVDWGTMQRWVNELTKVTAATPGYFTTTQVNTFMGEFLRAIQKEDVILGTFYDIGTGLLDYLGKSVK